MDMLEARKKEERALAAVEALWAAYESGSTGYFDLFTADASIFPLASGTRLHGREAYRLYCGETFQDQQRATHLLHAEVRLLGESALVTCHQRTRADYQSTDSRVTLLLVPEEGGLKVAHLHMSPLASAPAVDDDSRGRVEEVLGLAAPSAASSEER
jgi:ketosteroid isomerase-like protein